MNAFFNSQFSYAHLSGFVIVALLTKNNNNNHNKIEYMRDV